MDISRFNRWARAEPGRKALIYNDRPFSYVELARSIEAVRRQLAIEAPAPGRIAVVCTYSLLNAWVLVTAARALGLTAVPVDSMARARDLGLKDVGCVIAAGDEQALLTAGVPFPGVSPIVVPAAAINAGEGLEASVDLVEPGPPGGHVLYTSGTTGAYKKLLLDGDGQEARDSVRTAISHFSPQTVFHAISFGLWTGIGFKTSSAVWSAGGCVIIDQSEAKHANLLKHAPTYAQTLPESLRAIVDASDPAAARSRSMVLRVGGGFTPLALAERAVARISDTLVLGFSATELTAVMMMSEFRQPEDVQWLRPVDPGLVQVVDEDGVEAPANVEGELRFRLRETDSTAYLDDPEATAQAFRDGCFYSGDLAVRRDDGRVRILGRAADVINIGGQKRAVGPIEQTLQRGLGVAEVCLFQGVAADGAVELVVAVRSTAPLERAEVLRRLGPSEIFDRVRVEVLAEFPRTQTGTGKTRRVELRRMLFPSDTDGR
jgi:acyl-coenzyme A synthetase/AMP-(fatty) acid ligase